ncbi:hypothetical protein ACMGGD_20445 [Pseudomonas sp. BNK-6]|uniref:hypothetical protein n=1 Tax=unclassified Pseudomonas TaxID=196821 RepID=UPI003A88AA6F
MAVIVTTILAALYFIYFYFAKEEINAGSLGTLGDFIGGNINPVLTFVSTILLIETLSLQRKATTIAENEAADAKRTIKEQGTLIKTQIFESSFFNLINLCLEEYKNATIETYAPANKILEIKKNIYQGSKAFNYIEKSFSKRKNEGEPPDKILENLDHEHGDIIFNAIKTFSTVFGFVNENAPADTKEQYISLATKLTPTPIIYLICIAKLHSTWPIIKPFEQAYFFEKKGIPELLSGYS